MIDKIFSVNAHGGVLNAHMAQKSVVSDRGRAGVVNVVALEVKVVVAKEWRLKGPIHKVAVVGVEEGCGFLGAGNNGIAHELGFVGTGMGELVEGKVTNGQGDGFVLKFQGFQKKCRSAFINLSDSIEFFPFSRNALLKSKVEGSSVGEFFLKALRRSHHRLGGTDEEGGIPTIGT